MPVATMQGREIQLDDEGFLVDPAQWDEEVGRELGRAIGLELSPRHLEVIAWARADHGARGETPGLRRLQAEGACPTKEMFTLFPGKPAKKLAYVAGLPKPVGCV